MLVAQRILYDRPRVAGDGGESEKRIDDADLGPAFDVVAAEPAVIGMAAPGKQPAFSYIRPRRCLGRAFRQETPQRREAGAGADQDHRRGRIGGRREGRSGRRTWPSTWSPGATCRM